MRIGEIARRAGVAPSRVRFYEREGLLPGTPRQANGYRDYPASTIEILSFIMEAQSFGFSLQEIREALPLVSSHGKVAPEVTIPALERKLDELSAHIEASIEQRDRLIALLEEQRRHLCPRSDR